MFFDIDEVPEPFKTAYPQYKLSAEGTYNVWTQDCKEFEKKGCERILVTFLVLDGEHKDSTHTEFYNISGPNETANNIGKQKLKQLCQTIGKTKLENTNDLVGHFLEIKLKRKNEWLNIVEYLPRATPAPVLQPKELSDDEIPF